jgi:hypothetical protein
MLNLDQDKFITDFVTTFLATWSAEQHSRRLRDEAANDANLPIPIPQAINAARIAWMNLLAHGSVSSISRW